MSVTDKIVKKSDLKMGDIILMEGEEGSIISDIIMLLTESPVSHATVVSQNTAQIIHETKPCVEIAELDKYVKRGMYVMRHDNTELDMSKVYKIADQYRKEKLPYAMTDMAFFAIYHLVRIWSEKTMPKEIQDIVSHLFYFLTASLAKHAGRDYYGKKAMTCARFACTCYREAGEEYRIHLKRFESTFLDAIVEQAEEMNMSTDIKLENIEQLYEESVVENLQELSEQYYEAIKEWNSQKHENAPQEKLSEQLIKQVMTFLKVYLGECLKDQIQDNLDNTSWSELINLFQENLEVLVTPGDLLEKTTNLHCIGRLVIDESYS